MTVSRARSPMNDDMRAWQKVSDLVEEYAEASHTNSLGAYDACFRVYKIAKKKLSGASAAQS